MPGWHLSGGIFGRVIMNDVPSHTQFASQRSAVSGLAPLVAIVFCGILVVGAPLPALSLYVHEQLGFSSFTVGWVIGIQSIVTVLSRHYAGTLSDHHGPRWIVLRGLPLASLAAGCYLASALLPATSARAWPYGLRTFSRTLRVRGSSGSCGLLRCRCGGVFPESYTSYAAKAEYPVTYAASGLLHKVPVYGIVRLRGR